ncbi:MULTISPECIES: RNA-binding S4 domain-containing protein [unclassified Actinobaculum]|uniref:RNA-binding S4 domain-containing protein n=1 Tax=unclassified Actinobaculum TaxID=2609299 RepID=UPI000D528184|nr:MULTISPECIES: RNA-binding S4 domain-containing protein [unclassified Actinobaculum]AWE42585.1 RNA-binding protein [Actinobaculum sp. 313]RTE48124.1 RNA-binding S4 domain-containing protein [Actinobaculum sp. 352]
MDEIRVRLPIRLGQFLKLASLADSGAQARELIEDGEITVNDVVETHRGHRLADGDVVALDGTTVRVRGTDS